MIQTRYLNKQKAKNTSKIADIESQLEQARYLLDKYGSN